MARQVLGIQAVRETIRVHGERMEKVLIDRAGGPKIEALGRWAEGRGIAV